MSSSRKSAMECRECHSHHIHKNGHRKSQQNHICVKYGRQFITEYQHCGYSDDVKHNYLKMYVNAMFFRGIERITGVSRTTIMVVVKFTCRKSSTRCL